LVLKRHLLIRLQVEAHHHALVKQSPLHVLSEPTLVMAV